MDLTTLALAKKYTDSKISPSPDVIKQGVNEYLENHPVQVGASSEDVEMLQNVLGWEEISPSSSSVSYKLLGDGTASTDTNYSIDKYNISGFNKIIVQVKENGDGTYCFSSTDRLTGIIGTVKTDASNGFVDIPSNSNYIFVCYKKADSNYHKVYKIISDETTDETTTIDPSNISGVEEKSNLKLIDGSCYSTGGNITQSASWCRTDLIEVSAGDVVRITNGAYQYIAFFNENKEFVSKKDGATTPTTYTETISNGICYIGCNILATQKNNYSITINSKPANAIYEWDKLVINQENIGEDVVFDAASIWKGKKYISHGDSITWRDGNNWSDGTKAIGYQSIMNQQIGFSSYNNQGWSGHSMADGTSNGDGCVTRILSLDHTSYDLCTIACGTNDFKLNVPIGTLGVIGDTSFDRGTFYGAFRTSIEYLLTQKPTLRIALFTPLQRDNSGYDVNYTNSAGHKLIDYVDAIKELGKMYGLPVCDMYANSGITKLTLSTYTVDGLHPNNVGYERMGNYATQFINSIGL